jgi:purine-nucleoside phosphorylase
MSHALFERLEAAAAAIRARCARVPATAVVLGSGLGALVDALTEATVMAYDDLPHWPMSSVEGHRSELVLGRLDGRDVAVLAGRVHLYEGRTLDEVTFGIRVMGRLGVRRIVLTNAAGGINPQLEAGTLMVIDDHINLLGGNPLTGPNDVRLGPRFPDMTAVYSPRLRGCAHAVAREQQMPLARGVYAAMPGPGYETPAEVRYLRAIGVDAVGMSLVPEAIAAHHMGIAVLGISCITNIALSDTREPGEESSIGPVTHHDVLTTAHQAAGRLTTLVRGIVARTEVDERTLAELEDE